MRPRPCREGCGTDILLVHRAGGRRASWLVLEAADLNPDSLEAAYAFVVVGEQGWQLGDYIEHLRVYRGVSEDKARDLAGGYPWHRRHTCREDQR